MESFSESYEFNIDRRPLLCSFWRKKSEFDSYSRSRFIQKMVNGIFKQSVKSSELRIIRYSMKKK
jgi:hypothetical protein